MSDAERPAQRLAGPALTFDLAAELAQLRAEDRWAGGRSARTLVKERDFRVVLIALHEGARLEQHHAPGPIAIQALAGRLRLQLAGGPVELPAGHLLTLERAVPHDVEALEESAFLLTIGWPDPGAAAPPPSEGRPMRQQSTREGAAVDLAALARTSTVQGAVWAYDGDDLNANLILLAAGEEMAEHVNSEVEILLVGIAGARVVTVDGRRRPLGAGQVLVIPKGARRAIAGGDARFAYLTCHRRRAALWPANLPRPDARPAR